MKLFSILSIIVASCLIGYFLFLGLPKIAELRPLTPFSVDKSIRHNEVIDTQKVKEDLILRDKCNTYVASVSFASGAESDAFLESCLAGNETSKINVIGGISTATSSDIGTSSAPLSESELITKCNEFMNHAKFDSQKAADDFLKNCLAGN